MLRFNKGRQPESLTAMQATPGASWSRSRALWDDLLSDQGHLCAYCQRRIPTDGEGMHVEHWTAQATGQDDMRWRNLIAVCPGNPNLEVPVPQRPVVNKPDLHCDASRGDATLYLHPVEGEGPSPLAHLAYGPQGEAMPLKGCSNVERVSDDIKTLGLDLGRLRRARIEVYEGLKRYLEKSGFTLGAMKELYRKHQLVTGSRAVPQCEVARFYLARWARKRGLNLD